MSEKRETGFPGELIIEKVPQPEEPPREAEGAAGVEENTPEPAAPEAGTEENTPEAGTGTEESGPAPAAEAAAPAEDKKTGNAAAGQSVVEIIEAAPEDDTKPKKKFPRPAKALLIALAAVIAVGALYVFFCFFGVEETIQRPLRVNGQDLTGMTVAEAEEAVQEKFEADWKDAAYEVKVGEKTWDVPVYPSLRMDASSEIEAAYTFCHGAWYTRGYEYLKNMFFPEKTQTFEIEPEITETESIRAAVDEIAEKSVVGVKDASWTYDGETVTVQTGTHGESIDADALYREILDDLDEGQYSGKIDAKITIANPKNVDPKEIAAAVYTEPVNAAYAWQEGELTITPSAQGAQLTEEEIGAALDSAAEGSTVSLPKTILEPEIREDYLSAGLFADTISSYDVPDGGSPSQKNNQGLACQAINGTVLLPGEVFSFNDIVGDTTPEKGYVEDYAYNQGHLVTQYGGGVCRVASTLYAAVLGSNLEIVFRYNHSSPVHYLPLGMDATVSYPAPDLQFRNNQAHPIRIEMWLDGGIVHAGIIGTVGEGDPYVDVYLNPVTDMIVETWRMYYDHEGGELLEQEYISTSVYQELSYDYDD